MSSAAPQLAAVGQRNTNGSGRTEKLDISDLLIFCAVCEQALYLAMQAEQNASDRTGRIKSETIEGVGKREYFEEQSNGQQLTGHLAPRSELFLSRLPGVIDNGSRFSRG